MSKPQNPGWYWYNNGEDWEVVLVRELYELDTLQGVVRDPPVCLRGRSRRVAPPHQSLPQRDRFLYARRLEGPVQSPLPLSCLTGKWGKQIKRDER